LIEQLGMGEEQWRIPPKQDETWNQLPLGIAGDVVETSEVFDPAQHGKNGDASVPQKLNHGDHDCERNALNGAEHRYTREADHRQPELPALNSIDTE
jgi:hypothetical protein